MRLIRLPGLLLACAAMLAPVTPRAETLRIGGTGAGLAAMASLQSSLTTTTPEILIQLMPSLGTAGGLAALTEQALDIAITLRPLTTAEKAKGLTEATCMGTALIFATSRAQPSGITPMGITTAQLPRLYADPSPTWPDGTPLKLILRSRAGSENGYLAAAVSGMAAALVGAYQRPGIPIGATDQENADLAQRTIGSLTVMTLVQLRAERLNLRPLTLNGVAPTEETLADKTYPLSVPFCIIVPAAASPPAMQFIAHVRSAASQASLRSLGLLMER